MWFLCPSLTCVELLPSTTMKFLGNALSNADLNRLWKQGTAALASALEVHVEVQPRQGLKRAPPTPDPVPIAPSAKSDSTILLELQDLITKKKLKRKGDWKTKECVVSFFGTNKPKSRSWVLTAAEKWREEAQSKLDERKLKRVDQSPGPTPTARDLRAALRHQVGLSIHTHFFLAQFFLLRIILISISAS